jgi:hypothetical protein
MVKPSQASLDIALQFSRSPEAISMLESITLGARHDSEHFIEALAVGLNCGLEWIVSVSRSIQGGLERQKLSAMNRNFREHKSLSSRILALLVKGLDRHREHEELLAEHVLRFVMLILMFDLPLQAALALPDFTSSITCIPCPLGTVLGVATDLARAEFILQHRLWFLQPVVTSGGSCWKIFGKGFLFHPVGIKEQQGLVTLRKRQHIVG